MKFILFFICACLSSCAPATLKDLRCEGEAEAHKLARELRCLESKEDLQKALPRLKKRYNRIADLIIEVRRLSNPSPMEPMEPTLASEELFIELARLYEIPGARDLIETAQQEAIHRLSKQVATAQSNF